MSLPIVHHPDYDAKLPPTHRFPMSKYSRLMPALRLRGLDDDLHEPEPAGADLLRLAHDPAYVDQVLAAAVPREIEREIGFSVGPRVARRAQLAAAGTLLAARLALREGIACNAAGGSHHARRERGSGFCTFNDVAIAASALLETREVARVLVVDLDVHQGDGTAAIFAAEPRVFTFSMHAQKNFPTRKEVSDLDVGLEDGLGDGDYVAMLARHLPAIAERSRPDIVFYNAGVDPHVEDRLGRLSLSDEGLRARDGAVIGFFSARKVPVCGVIGGGYSRDIDALAARHAILFETASAFC